MVTIFETTSAFSAAAEILISDNAGLFGDKIKSTFGGRFIRKLERLFNSIDFLLFVDIFRFYFTTLEDLPTATFGGKFESSVDSGSLMNSKSWLQDGKQVVRQSMECKNTVSDTPLTGIHQNFSKFQSHKEVTCEKVARADLVERLVLIPTRFVQLRPESPQIVGSPQLCQQIASCVNSFLRSSDMKIQKSNAESNGLGKSSNLRFLRTLFQGSDALDQAASIAEGPDDHQNWMRPLASRPINCIRPTVRKAKLALCAPTKDTFCKLVTKISTCLQANHTFRVRIS